MKPYTLLLIVLCAACARVPTDPASTVTALPPELRPRVELACDVGACPQTTCAHNSPELTGFPLGALSLDGCRNPGGVSLVQGSLSAPRCGGELDLAFADGALAGRRPGASAPTCRGADLEGATFWIDGPRRATGPIAGPPVGDDTQVRQQLRLVSVDTGPAIPTYRVIRTGRATVWQDDRWVVRAETLPALSACNRARESDLYRRAIVVAGDRLDDDAATILASGPSTFAWIHFACEDSALAKMRELGYDPMDGASTAGERQATLRMITARYCKAAGGAFTTAGVPVHWKKRGESDAPLTADEGPLEARWNQDGATCLSHARIFRRSADHPLAPLRSLLPDGCCADEATYLDMIRAKCGLASCPQVGPQPTDHVWSTFTVDHIHRDLTAPVLP